MKIILHTLLFLVLAGVPCSAAVSRHGGGTPVPPAASAAGYTTHTYSASKFSAANVDMGLTYASGFKLYPWNYFGLQTPASAIRFNSDTSVQVDNAGGLSSAASIVSAPYFVGTAFGCGAYMTAELSFNQEVGMGLPAWWAMSLEHLARMDVGSPNEHWPGEVAGYNHYAELDIIEFNQFRPLIPHAYAFGSAMHDWYGIMGTTCGVANADCDLSVPNEKSSRKVPDQTDFNLFHRIAALWIPATATTSGSVNIYFDDILLPDLTGGGFSWSQYTSQAAPPTLASPWLFGVLDQQHLALILGWGKGAGVMNFSSVDVWQGPNACNITN